MESSWSHDNIDEKVTVKNCRLGKSNFDLSIYGMQLVLLLKQKNNDLSNFILWKY